MFGRKEVEGFPTCEFASRFISRLGYREIVPQDRLHDTGLEKHVVYDEDDNVVRLLFFDFAKGHYPPMSLTSEEVEDAQCDAVMEFPDECVGLCIAADFVGVALFDDGRILVKYGKNWRA